jgi:small nuclear ribonucleoprotein
MAKRPLDVLHAALNQRVTVELRGGREYRGTLDGYDHPHLNLVIRDAEEVKEGASVRRYEHVLVRGDAIVYITP